MFNKKFKLVVLVLCMVLIMGCFTINTQAVSTVLLAVQGTIVDGNLVKFSGVNGIGVDTGVSASNVVKNKFDATIAPTVNNDVDEGYTVGSRWLDVTNDKSYICLDNTDSAAVWHLDVVGPGSSTDHAIVRWDSTTGRTTLNSVVTISDTGVVIGGTWGGLIEITIADATAQIYIHGSNILANGEQAIYINCPSEDGATNAVWFSLGSTVVTGDLTGARIKTTSQAASGGDAASGVNVRGVYAQAIAAASKHAGLLQGGLFVADVSAGSVTAYNIHILCGHYSAGESTVIGGDLYVGLLRSQTREDNARTVAGYDALLALENEAIQGDGGTVDVAIRIFDTNIAGSVKGFTYGIDLSDAKIATADIRLSNSETISNTTDGRVTIGGGDLNIDSGKVYMINGSQIKLSDCAATTSAELAGVISDETGSGLSVFGTSPAFTTNFVIDRASDTLPPYFSFQKARDGDPTSDVSDDDLLGRIYFRGYHTDGYDSGAIILAAVDGTPGNTDMPSRLEFYTSPDASATPLLRMTIDSTGAIICSAGLTVGGDVILGANSIGRDADNDIDFETDNQILFRTSGIDNIKIDSSGNIDMQQFAILIDDALGTDEDYSGIIDTANVGETVAVGDLLYYNWGDSEWKKAKADAAATMPALRIALAVATDGNPCLMLIMGYIRDDDAYEMTGAMIYVSDATAGAVQYAPPADAGDQVQRIGVGITADKMFFCPSIDVGEI